ncbi:MAG: hypothetical protein E7E23_18435 [Paenibacillus sp.]|uniref:hypothetical protein n=1 Tax=Paenibacillus sp. TaxID=58172 RepID=UPI0029023B75|nr:hypothetical protein [Paenibacillus sp.]MDU2242550.1 hypothetical protein [Paenibacillus sp.]
MRKSYIYFDEENLDDVMEYLDELNDSDEEFFYQWDGIDSTVVGGCNGDPWGEDE